MDALLDQADAEPNQATRMALYAQAQQMITTDLPAAYMYNNLNAYLVKPRVQGVKTTPQDSDWAGSRVPLSITLQIGSAAVTTAPVPNAGTVGWRRIEQRIKI